MPTPIKTAVFFAIVLLCLCACHCSEPKRSPRQKRGLVKMMMHIMWDPVRLIRYWYAYDVTKEIAKSWRKILPTIMLLPVTEHMPDSHGFAKYVHPTVGLRDSNKHKKPFQYPSIPFNQEYSGSTFIKDYYPNKHFPQPSDQPSDLHPNLSPVPPEFLHEMFPYSHSFGSQDVPFVSHDHGTTSREIEDSFPSSQLEMERGRDKTVNHMILEHTHHELPRNVENRSPHSSAVSAEGSRNEHIVLKPFKGAQSISFPDASSGHIVLKAVPLPLYNGGGIRFEMPDDLKSGANDDASGSHSRVKNMVNSGRPYSGAFSSGTQSSEIQVPVQDGRTPHVLYSGNQEIHIVLHPIPVRDFPDHSGEMQDQNHAVHYLPLNLLANSSSGSSIHHIPFVIKALSQGVASAEGISSTSQEASDLQTKENNFHANALSHMEDSENLSKFQEGTPHNSSEESNGNQSPIVWTSSSTGNLTRRKDNKEFDLESDDTILRISSVQRLPSAFGAQMSKSAASETSSLNRHQIDIVRLKEDLKHGTPVLIPFNRNIYQTDQSEQPHSPKTTFGSSKLKNRNKSSESSEKVPTTSSEVQSEKMVGHGIGEQHSLESSSANRLILFLAKKKQA